MLTALVNRLIRVEEKEQLLEYRKMADKIVKNASHTKDKIIGQDLD